MALLAAENTKYFLAVKCFRFALLYYTPLIESNFLDGNASREFTCLARYLLFQAALMWIEEREEYIDSLQSYEVVGSKQDYDYLIKLVVDTVKFFEAVLDNEFGSKAAALTIEFLFRAALIEEAMEKIAAFLSRYEKDLEAIEYLAAHVLSRSQCPIQGN
jgi:hypothetical protein